MIGHLFSVYRTIKSECYQDYISPTLPLHSPPPLFFLSMNKEVVHQGEFSHLSKTCVIPLNKKTCVRGKTGAVLMEEIAV